MFTSKQHIPQNFEIQQLPNTAQHMNTGDVIQIEAPDFDPDINEGLPTQEQQEAQGSTSSTQRSLERADENKTLALLYHEEEDVDWPDAIPVKILPQLD